jgi:hypothetical protein
MLVYIIILCTCDYNSSNYYKLLFDPINKLYMLYREPILVSFVCCPLLSQNIVSFSAGIRKAFYMVGVPEPRRHAI